jgi:putative oxidoreductase
MGVKDSGGLASDLGLLALRAVAGGLLAGHGAQKLFGSFGGHGIEGTAGWLESLGLRPGKAWAALAGGSELGAGALMALGLLSPLGPIAVVGPMVMAWAKAHGGKPIWITAGGAELPLLNLAAAGALALTGPGRLSLDELLGIETPKLLTAATALGVAGGLVAGLLARPDSPPAAELEPAREVPTAGPQGGEGLHSEAAAGAQAAPAGGDGPAKPEPHHAGALSNASGTVIYGGLAAGVDPDQIDLEAEVGGDPPGAFGFNLRGADDTTGSADEPEERPLD